MPLKASDVETLVELFRHSTWDELRLEIDGALLLLSTDSRADMAASAGVPTPAPRPAPGALAAAPQAATPAGTTAPRPDTWVCVKAPNLGTFYTAPAPDKPPYVTVGTAVTPDTEVCLIEVMKLFTTVRAGVAGTVREIAAQDGEMVEYEQPLLWIEPTARQ